MINVPLGNTLLTSHLHMHLPKFPFQNSIDIYLRPRKYHKLQTHAPVALSPYLTEISDSQQIC